MPWVKTDHNIHQHPKFQDMPGDEFQIWHQGLSYAAEWWTDGFIPASKFPKKSQQKFIFDLQKRKLWHPISVNGVVGYQINDYEKYQTLKADYEQKKLKDKTRKRGDDENPNGNNGGNSTESKQIPDGIHTPTELNLTPKNLSPRFPQSSLPTPVPPQATRDELELKRNPMPEDAKSKFQEMGYR